jgi:peptidoglycan hydrolase FlgJ
MPIQNMRGSGSFPPSLPGEVSGKEDQKIKKACAEFESIFIQLMLKSMRQTVMKADCSDKGSGREMFDSLFDQELSKVFAKGRGTGLAKLIYQNWMKKERSEAPSPERSSLWSDRDEPNSKRAE